jgi:hypothetical protein
MHFCALFSDAQRQPFEKELPYNLGQMIILLFFLNIFYGLQKFPVLSDSVVRRL